MAERWYEIVGYFDPDKKEEVNADGISVIVRGSIDSVIIVQVPRSVESNDAHRIMQSVQATMEGGGVNRPLVLMPDHIKFMKVRKLSPEEMRDLRNLSQSSESVH